MTTANRPRNPYLGISLLMLELMALVVAAGAAGSHLLSTMESKAMAVACLLALNSLCFAIPALLTRRIIVGNESRLSRQQLNAAIITGLLVIAVMSQPLVEWAAFLNECMSRWPMLSSLFGERDTTSAELLQEVIRFDSISGWLTTIILVSLLPAVCEELFFRLTLMPALKRATHSWHAAIIISAVVFSAMHMDAFGFLPRLILGGILGVVFYLTKNIWASIIIHATNNLLVVISLALTDMPVAKALTMPAEEPGIVMPVLSVLIVIMEIYTIEKITHGKTPSRQETNPA